MKSFLLHVFYLVFCFCSLLSGSAQDDQVVKRVTKIHREALTVDSHTDTPLRLMQSGFDISARHDPVNDHSKLDFPRMKEGGLDAAFFGIFVSQGKRIPEANARAKEKAWVLFDTIYSVTKRFPDLCRLALSPSDAYRLKRKGKRAIFIGIENGYPIGNDIDLIKFFMIKAHVISPFATQGTMISVTLPQIPWSITG